MLSSGAFWFGVVIGYVTYRTLHHKKGTNTADIAAVIGAVGGGVVVNLFPTQDGRFDEYAYGLAIGFFVYLLLSLVLSLFVGAKLTKEMLGDETPTLRQ